MDHMLQEKNQKNRNKTITNKPGVLAFGNNYKINATHKQSYLFNYWYSTILLTSNQRKIKVSFGLCVIFFCYQSTVVVEFCAFRSFSSTRGNSTTFSKVRQDIVSIVTFMVIHIPSSTTTTFYRHQLLYSSLLFK